MPRSPQDVYARLLSSRRGYPLWTPEPSNELLIERRDGLRIGDVGVVIPDDGGFDVFFNICLPADHPFHRRHGVPEGFTFIHPGELDIRTIPNAEYSGRIISTSSVTQVETPEPSSSTPQGDETSALAYRFTLSSNEGALLILPKGAEQIDLLSEGLFAEQASLHGPEWYNYAVNRRHRIINPDSLYLITGFYKAQAWSVAAFENMTGSECHTAHFKRIQARTQRHSNGPTHIWETSCALDWRVGPYIDYGVANQAVFIRGLKIALRNGLLGTRWVSVEADFPSTRPIPAKLSSIVSSNLWSLRGFFSRPSRRGRGNDVPRTTAHNLGTAVSTEEPLESDVPTDSGYDDVHVEIQRVPDVPAVFHPSDAINQYLLCKEPSADIAITHDNLWISILEDGLLTLEEFRQESRLETVLSQNYNIVSREGVTHLERKNDLDVPDGDETLGAEKEAFSDSSPLLGTLAVGHQYDGPVMTGDRAVDTWSKAPPKLSTEYFPWNTGHSRPPPASSSLGPRRANNFPSYEAQQRFSPNVLIFGETGAGKSSVVNLIAGELFASVHSGAGAGTLEATSYDIILPDNQGLSHHIRLFDTVSLNEPQFKKTDYLSAIEKANTLICRLQRTGGIRLLLFCFRAGRITATMQSNYRLFCEVLCQNKVPVAFVITGLENEESMEAWWERNVSLFEASRLFCVSHACVTATRGPDGYYSARYDESQKAVRAMLLEHVTGGSTSWQPERMELFVHLSGKLLKWLGRRVKGRRRQALTVEELADHLRDRCKFSRSEAEYLAPRIWAQRLESTGPGFVKSDNTSSIDSL